jgi:hypothetical protein
MLLLLSAYLLLFPSAGAAQKPDDVPPEVVVADAPPQEARVDVDVRMHVEVPPPERPVDPGTHFLTGIEGGMTVSGGIDFAGALTFGIGGKFVGFPLRFYALGEVGYAGAEHADVVDGRAFSESRSAFDLALGLRVYIPVFGPLRLFVDTLGGAAMVNSTLVRPGMTTLESDNEWAWAFVAGAGVQVRLFENLSIGGRLRLLFTDDPLSDLRDQLGIGTPIPVSVTVGATWHF